MVFRQLSVGNKRLDKPDTWGSRHAKNQDV